MAVSGIQSTIAELNKKASVSSSANDTASADRFLKLLVAQLQNQDPLNPMDNAQVTSQMAQINTVTGIEKLNTTVQGLSGQFVQMQALQGASLIGNEVIVPGNKVDVQEGLGQGGFQLESAADHVTVEVLNSAGKVIDTLKLGAHTAGIHSFDWTAGNNPTAGVTFKVSATNGANKLTATALMRDKVESVSTAGGQLMLSLEKAGDVAYSDVKAIN